MKTVQDLMNFLSTLDPTMPVLKPSRGMLARIKANSSEFRIPMVSKVVLDTIDRDNTYFIIDSKNEEPDSIDALIL